MNKYIDAEKLKKSISNYIEGARAALNPTDGDADYYKGKIDACKDIQEFIGSLQQEQPDEQPEYGYLSTEYVHGRKSKWNVGDVLAYYICTSNEEGERPLGKIVNVEFDEEDGWIYTFEYERTWDEQSLIEEGVYKIIENGK